MAAVRDLSTGDAVFKSMINSTLHVKDFPHVECLHDVSSRNVFCAGP